MDKFFIKKESNTFTDSIEALGLASIINNFFSQVLPDSKPEIMIEDYGYAYKLKLNKLVTDDLIRSCHYFDFIRYIAAKSVEGKELTFSYIDYEDEKKKRDAFQALSPKERKDAENPVRPDYDIIRMFANMEGYRKSFYNCREWKDHFSQFLNFIFQYYSDIEGNDNQIHSNISKYIKENGLKINKINALQDINPDKGKGANQLKADGITPKGQSDFWLQQLVRFCGVWQSFVSRYFDKDIKTYSLVPNKISFDNISYVYKRLKPLVRGNDSIKVDILLIQLLTKELILRDIAYSEISFVSSSPKDKISGFQMAYYKNLGQRPAVTNIGFLGIPEFIKFSSKAEGNIWREFLDEHIKIISNIDEKNSSNINMLQNYRQFISAGDFSAFFNFCYEYGRFLISMISNKKYYIKPFTINKMEVVMQTESSYIKVLENTGFQAVAAAIRNSTIVPIIHKNKKDVIFGLSQKFKIASRDKTSLAAEVSEFIQQYNEAVMLKDYHRRQHHKYVTTEELQEFFKLLDGEHSSKLISGMLIAYGYAKNPAKENESQEVNHEED